MTASREEAPGRPRERAGGLGLIHLSLKRLPCSQIPNPASQAQPQPQTHRNAPQADGQQSPKGTAEPLPTPGQGRAPSSPKDTVLQEWVCGWRFGGKGRGSGHERVGGDPRHLAQGPLPQLGGSQVAKGRTILLLSQRSLGGEHWCREGAGEPPTRWYRLEEARPNTAHPEAGPRGQAIGLEWVGGRQLRLGRGGEGVGEGSKGEPGIAADTWQSRL